MLPKFFSFFKSLGGIFDSQAEVFRMGTWRGKVSLDTGDESWGHRWLGTEEVPHHGSHRSWLSFPVFECGDRPWGDAVTGQP